MHCVTVEFPVADGCNSSDLFELEELLAVALRSAKAGQVDGNEIGGQAWMVFMYGKSADALFDAIRPVLRRRVRKVERTPATRLRTALAHADTRA